LYESTAEFVIFGILYWRVRRQHTPGGIISLYPILYSNVRFLVEFVRYHDQPNPFGGPPAHGAGLETRCRRGRPPHILTKNVEARDAEMFVESKRFSNRQLSHHGEADTVDGVGPRGSPPGE